MSTAFTTDDLSEIREFVNAIEHTVPIPAPLPDNRRLDVTVILHDGVGDVAAVATITNDIATRIHFPAAVTGDQLRALLEEHKA